MVSIEEMRFSLLRLYASDTWRQRVLNMADAQIVAIYRSKFKI